MPNTYPAYRGLRFEEDIALEQRLSGITVPNAQGQALPVKVIYRMPDRELTTMTFPCFVIQFLGIFPRTNEEHRGVVMFGMEPYTGNYLSADDGPPGTGRAYGEFPVPITLRYQVSVYSRVQQHDVVLNDMCATTFFPIRYGQLSCPSGTVRRLDFQSMYPADILTGDNQKTYRKIWTIAVSSEIVPVQWTATPVTEVDLTVYNGLSDQDPVDEEFIIPVPQEP